MANDIQEYRMANVIDRIVKEALDIEMEISYDKRGF
jgi:hypothetical protein